MNVTLDQSCFFILVITNNIELIAKLFMSYGNLHFSMLFDEKKNNNKNVQNVKTYKMAKNKKKDLKYFKIISCLGKSHMNIW